MKSLSNLKRYFDEKLVRIVGRWFSRQDESGHTRICRFISWVCHFGQNGTFVIVDRHKLDAGGHICTFGAECGKPTGSYTRQMNERLEWFRRTSALLQESGAIQSFVWSNPKFSVDSLCTCGNSDNQRFSDHHPLCRYRTEHHRDVTLEEYRDAINSRPAN